MDSFFNCNFCKSVKIDNSITPIQNTDKLEIRLLIIGLDNSGKTTLINRLSKVPFDDAIPTVGFSVVEMKKFDRFKVIVYDLGGGLKIRAIWTNYYALVHGIIFVIDSSDFNRLDQVKEVFESVVSNEKVQGKPILIMLNKIDLHNIMDEIDILNYISIVPLINQFKCPTKIESCSGISNDQGSGLVINNGYQWILKYIKQNWIWLNSRVQIESNKQNAAERQILEDRIKKFRELKAAQTSHEDVDENIGPNENKNPFKPIEEIVDNINEMNKLVFVTDALLSAKQTNDSIEKRTNLTTNTTDKNENDNDNYNGNKGETENEIFDSNGVPSAQGVDEVIRLFTNQTNLEGVVSQRESKSECDIYSSESLIENQNDKEIQIEKVNHEIENEKIENEQIENEQIENEQIENEQIEQTKNDKLVNHLEHNGIQGSLKSSSVTPKRNTFLKSHKKDKKRRMKVFNRNKVSPVNSNGFQRLRSKSLELI